jgi:hypothetical protein
VPFRVIRPSALTRNTLPPDPPLLDAPLLFPPLDPPLLDAPLLFPPFDPPLLDAPLLFPPLDPPLLDAPLLFPPFDPPLLDAPLLFPPLLFPPFDPPLLDAPLLAPPLLPPPSLVPLPPVTPSAQATRKSAEPRARYGGVLLHNEQFITISPEDPRRRSQPLRRREPPSRVSD